MDTYKRVFKQFVVESCLCSSQGFSLLEALITLSIVGILTALATSTPQVNQNIQYKTNISNLVDAIQQARDSARNNNLCATVSVNPATQIVTITTLALPCILPLTGAVQVTSTVQLDSAVTLTPFSPMDPLYFNNNGGLISTAPPNPAAAESITLSEFNYSGAIQILPILGQVKPPL